MSGSVAKRLGNYEKDKTDKLVPPSTTKCILQSIAFTAFYL